MAKNIKKAQLLFFHPESAKQASTVSLRLNSLKINNTTFISKILASGLRVVLWNVYSSISNMTTL